LTLEFPGDEGMTIDPVAGGEGEERTDAENHGTEDFIPNVEVVVSVTSPISLDDAIVRILGRVLRRARTKTGARFHGSEDEVDAKTFPTFHGAEIGAGVVFLPKAFLLHVWVRPLQGDAMVASKDFHPMLVVLRSLPQHRFRDGVDGVHVAEEIDDVLRTSEQWEITLDDDAIETVVYKSEQAGKQLVEGFHRSSTPA
jgi:hypothetical protein